jgi:predicted nucleotide-binding protein/O-acetyl-ADP-ribose deacetylase (regulator of RNase III)
MSRGGRPRRGLTPPERSNVSCPHDVKPRIFLASSTPAKKRMHDIAGWLKDWDAEPLPWDKVGLFQPGDYILERLLDISQNVDGALMLFGDEDREWYHEGAQPQPRDNVLIEYGIFASQLGRDRTVVCRIGDPKNASDLAGLIFLQFGGARAKDDDARSRLRDWVRKLPELTIQARDADRTRREKANAPAVASVDAIYRPPWDATREVRIQTGPLKDLRGIDVIVCSENTDLQPARFYDRSMSGMLRYLDAEKNRMSLRVKRDAYLESLTAAIKSEDVELPVLPGSVLPVPTSGLKAQGTKFVFQAAVVEGKVGQGYRGSETAIDDAVRNSFARFAELSALEPLESILFPMFGVGSGRLGEDAVAAEIVGAIDKHLRTTPQIKVVYLYAFVEPHRAAFRNAAETVRWVKG